MSSSKPRLPYIQLCAISNLVFIVDKTLLIVFEYSFLNKNTASNWKDTNMFSFFPKKCYQQITIFFTPMVLASSMQKLDILVHCKQENWCVILTSFDNLGRPWRPQKWTKERKQFFPVPTRANFYFRTTPPISPTMLLDAQWAGRHLGHWDLGRLPQQYFLFFSGNRPAIQDKNYLVLKRFFLTSRWRDGNPLVSLTMERG